ncbi:Protein fam72a [Chytridiales sp. JEL 0842]|nr:Protein fam72a [Chytridiales sp. JEL 0842]
MQSNNSATPRVVGRNRTSSGISSSRSATSSSPTSLVERINYMTSTSASNNSVTQYSSTSAARRRAAIRAATSGNPNFAPSRPTITSSNPRSPRSAIHGASSSASPRSTMSDSRFFMSPPRRRSFDALAAALLRDEQQHQQDSGSEDMLIDDQNFTSTILSTASTRIRNTAGPTTGGPSIHPQFRSKAVCNLNCKHCGETMCQRGMKAILLGNTKVELYSTDTPPAGVQLVYKDYTTANCRCRIRDAACLGCGNIVGYHVTMPCSKCLDACNNGHMWMFSSDGVQSSERMEGSKVLRWASLLGPNDENDEKESLRRYETLCR